MIWKITKDLEETYKKCFAIFPVEVDGYIVWLSSYYKTWDYTNMTYGYIPKLFLCEKDVVEYIAKKKERRKC